MSVWGQEEFLNQGDSEKIRFPLSSDERDGLSAITLNQFNGSGG